MKTSTWVATAAVVLLAACGSADPLAPVIDEDAGLEPVTGLVTSSHGPGEQLPTPCLLTAPPPETERAPRHSDILIFRHGDCPDAPPFAGGLDE